MKNILIFSENTALCGSPDVYCDFLASHETISDKALILKRIESFRYDGLIIDASARDTSFLTEIEQIVNSGNPETVAVYLPGGQSISEFAKIGITSFFTFDSLKEGVKSVFGLTKRLKAREDVFLKALNRLRSLADSLDQGVLLLDTTGRVNFANNASLKILGMTQQEINRKTPDEIFSVHPYSQSSDSPERFEQTRHKTVNGRELTLDSFITPTYEDSDYAGSIIIFNITSGQTMDRSKELELLKFQDRYHSTQQSAAFKKQMLVIKDEVSGTLSNGYCFETYFKPLDVMSGDIYGTLNIKDGRYFFYIVDAMGKGLSASVTALLSSSFINHAAELSIIKEDFNFERTISSFTSYIRDRLMEEEALCAVFVLLDTNLNKISVCSFGMPPLMLCRSDGSVERLRTPGLPIMRFLSDKRIHEFSLEGVTKLLIYSDGLSESLTKEGELYFPKLPNALKAAATKKHLLKMANSEIIGNDDDITFFFITSVNADVKASEDFSVKSSPYHLGAASESINSFMEANGIDIGDIMTMEFALGEMLMNAMEHGSFGINFSAKQELIKTGAYDALIEEFSAEGSENFEKNIDISCRILERGGTKILMTAITDSGNGFSVSEIFKFHSFDGNLAQIDGKKYNGRGIFITDNLVDGLFYNEKGNTVYILKVLDS